MSTLVSPGVSVTVTDDSFYAASGAGTIPLVIFVTAQDKLVPGSTTTIAAGTQKANAGTIYSLTSQQDVLTTFGNPIFQTDSSSAVLQGDELNEYGLHALFSAMGITNTAYGVRADLDLNELAPTEVEPRGVPANATLWLDTAKSSFGVFYYNGGTSANAISNWSQANVLVPTIAQLDQTTGIPLSTLGTTGDYAYVPYVKHSAGTTMSNVISITNSSTDVSNAIYTKTKTSNGQWVLVSNITYQAMNAPAIPTGSAPTVWVKYDSSASGTSLVFKRFASGTSSWTTLNTAAAYDFTEIEASLGAYFLPGVVAFRGRDKFNYTYSATTATTLTIPDVSVLSGKSLKVRYANTSASTVSEAYVTYTSISNLVTFITANTPLIASASGTALTVKSMNGLSFSIVEQSWTAGNSTAYTAYSNTNWALASYTASTTAPTHVPTDGTYWYDNSLYADIMINDGSRWRGINSTAANTYFGHSVSRAIIFADTEPSTKADGSALVYGDIWIDPSLGSSYTFYQYIDAMWVLKDQTDQSTTHGMLFADARGSDENGINYFTNDSSTAYSALSISDYLDPDAPEPRKYPSGMILVNLRQTGGVVRKYESSMFSTIEFNSITHAAVDQYYIGDSNAYTLNTGGVRVPLTLAGYDSSNLFARWSTASGKRNDGSGIFGSEAQRKVIVTAMAATISSNDHIRADTIEYNILTAPGYVEMLDELVTLNTDRKETAYIITDVPSTLVPTATAINAWATNSANAPENNAYGRVTRYAYAAQYMGWCYGTNADGVSVAVPGSTVALRTYLYNDSVSYVWFPPAGTERGIVTNASSVGYITSEGEYASVIYNQGQRDAMYTNNINPIAMRPNRGLLVYGDKSLSPETTALDRVNVGRLVVYIRTELAKIAERFLFKLNTARVRTEFGAAITSFLANIVQLEGLEDFVVVCDSTNNTAARRNRNELWADVAFVPTKSINFVYVPLRIEASSTD
jgi:hypothetical protein